MDKTKLWNGCLPLFRFLVKMLAGDGTGKKVFGGISPLASQIACSLNIIQLKCTARVYAHWCL